MHVLACVHLFLSYLCVFASASPFCVFTALCLQVMGIAIFSPPLDSHGNSVKGVKFCQELLKHYPFGVFDSLAAKAVHPHLKAPDAAGTIMRKLDSVDDSPAVSALSATTSGIAR